MAEAPVGQFQKTLQLDHQDTAFTLYVQGKHNDDRSRARMSLLGQILSAPYYQYMRTEQQLGYIVFATPYPQQTVPALAFIVQSPEATPQQILEHSQTFFTNFASTLKAMSQDEFSNFKQGLINLLLEKPKNMAEKASRFWRELGDHRYQFDTNEAIAAEVETLTLEDVQALYQQAILEQQHPWLMLLQGGELEGVADLTSVDRSALPAFALPDEREASAETAASDQ